MCECDDHETEIMLHKECGAVKNNLLCKHSEHEWPEDGQSKCSKCENKQPKFDHNLKNLEFTGEG
jgi:hypothetical protein